MLSCFYKHLSKLLLAVALAVFQRFDSRLLKANRSLLKAILNSGIDRAASNSVKSDHLPPTQNDRTRNSINDSIISGSYRIQTTHGMTSISVS
jgi:hypothetical protein